MFLLSQLEQIIPSGLIKCDELLSKHTNFRIGGPALFWVEIKSVSELQAVIALCHSTQTPWVVLGGGSNTLASDVGFAGVVIQLNMRMITIEGTRVTAQAGVLSAGMARTTAQAGLDGFVWAISLPGTIGGAIRGNAGCFGGETYDHLVSVQVLRDGVLLTLLKSEITFGYRESMFKHTQDVIVQAEFELTLGDAKNLTAQLDQFVQKRKSTQPLDAGSAGCVFKNVVLDEHLDTQRLRTQYDIPLEMLSSRRISAGWLIDKLDLRGQCIGDAQVSQVHGNFIVNKGHATADQIVQLIALAKTRARDQFGLSLQEEVYYLGF